jgi:transmembrane sensor
MIEDIQPHSQSSIMMEACAWIAQLETDELKKEDLAAFREWMSRSPAHQKEIKRLAVLSNELNVLTQMAPSLSEAITQRNSAVNKKQRKVWQTKWSGAAVLCLSVFILSYISLFERESFVSQSPLILMTAVGEYKEVTLSDGSIAKLNTDSELEIDFSSERRKVRLLKGEAFFQVTHNPDRPFIVYADKQSVRAVGTAFSVRHLLGDLEVIVTEGKVKLANTLAVNITATVKDEDNEQKQEIPDNLIDSDLFLVAGETYLATNSKTGAIGRVSQEEINRKMSWQKGMFDFSETPLIDVINDLNRYTQHKIEISDPKLGELKFGGIFKTNELETLLDALETTFNISVIHEKNGVIRLANK